MKENCDKCKELGEDRRTLWMACFYAMEELGIPFETEKMSHMPVSSGQKEFYKLRVCKDCRADWLQAIRDWFKTPVKKDSEHEVTSGIYIKRLGHITQISREEWDKLYPRVEPVIFKNASDKELK